LVSLFTASHLALSLFCWSTAAVAVLVLLHELGHAVVAKWLAIEVHGVVFAAGGGCCITEGAQTPGGEALYSAAGLAAQLPLLACSTLCICVPSGSMDMLPGCAAAVFTAVNVFLLLVNSWPSPGSDGRRIANALAQWWQRVPASRAPGVIQAVAQVPRPALEARSNALAGLHRAVPDPGPRRDRGSSTEGNDHARPNRQTGKRTRPG
jgi:Zn-dependent protease